MPITVLFTGFALPAGWVSAAGFYRLLQYPLARLYLCLVISLPLFHGMHRIPLTSMDFGLQRVRIPLAVLLYGVAIGGTIAAIVVLVQL